MRIAVVNQHIDEAVGGSELQCHLVAEGLGGRGHDVAYLAVSPSSDASARSLRDRAGGRGGARYSVHAVDRTPEAIIEACVDARAEVVYWRMNRTLLREVVAGLSRAGIPLVFAIAHIDDVSPWPHRPWLVWPPRAALGDVRLRLRERRSWSTMAEVAAVASQRADFLEGLRVADKAVVRNLAPTGREEFVWPRPYVAWVGSLQGRKRPELLPAIAGAVAPFGLDVLVAGEVREERYRALFSVDEPPSNLIHLGMLPLDDVTGLLAGARALVVTAREEGFANVLIQAWWNGTPTISLHHDPDAMASRLGLGSSCDGDVDELLSRVTRLAGQSPDLAAAGRAHISTIAREEFSRERALDALEAMLQRARSKAAP